MSENSTQVSYVTVLEKHKGGQTLGIVSLIVGILSIFFFSFILSPVVFLVGVIGLIFSVRAKNGAGIGMNIGGIIAALIGAMTSPVLIGFAGLFTHMGRSVQ